MYKVNNRIRHVTSESIMMLRSNLTLGVPWVSEVVRISSVLQCVEKTQGDTHERTVGLILESPL